MSYNQVIRYSGFHRAIDLDYQSTKRIWQSHLANEIEADQLENLRELYRRNGLKPPSYTALVVKAIAKAVDELKTEYPELNSFLKRGWFRRSIHLFEKVSAGVAVSYQCDEEDYVAIAVIEEPQKQGLAEISKALQDASSLKSVPVQNAIRYYKQPWLLQKISYWISQNLSFIRYKYRGTFCVSSLGKYGVDYQLTLPQAATLQFGFGEVRDRVFARDGKPYVCKGFLLTLSINRLIMNGPAPSALLHRVREILNLAQFDEKERLTASLLQRDPGGSAPLRRDAQTKPALQGLSQ